MLRVAPGAELVPFLDPRLRSSRREGLEHACVLNGALYYAEIEQLRTEKAFVTEQTVAYVMDAERSVDIDQADDLARVEAFLGRRR